MTDPYDSEWDPVPENVARDLSVALLLDPVLNKVVHDYGPRALVVAHEEVSRRILDTIEELVRKMEAKQT